MAKAKFARDDEGRLYGIMFACPGCTGEGTFVRHHMIHATLSGETESPHTTTAPHWDFNGNMDSPTFQPSVLASHPIKDDDDKVIGRYVCHSFVTDGQIQFLSDCSHSLKGQTVDLPDVVTDNG
jgi:hypothetical protein